MILIIDKLILSECIKGLEHFFVTLSGSLVHFNRLFAFLIVSAL